ncbi:hypothetical protein [Streptomyces sp. SAJ15]|uniref:hypothetical protein n=1 Tax=Streptomyces sp. SAJ15 TaxID=2011095 RepID=UPI001185ACA0|nr:hypothetical protein [Streptomyces sp. SAJ15]TVL87893.1 hypothetical protein CD790_32275 [Streptomyces sp. SAJ15]
MRRGLLHALAWALATSAAMAVSWYGVRTVLTGTAYEPPRALPISDAALPTASPELASSTHRPKPPSVDSPTPPRRSGRATPRPAAPSPPRPPSRPRADGGKVKNYSVKGGRVVFDLGTSSATLVSATPDAEWQMRVWTQSAWIRVDFVSDEETTSVFATWNGHPPRVQVVQD